MPGASTCSLLRLKIWVLPGRINARMAAMSSTGISLDKETIDRATLFTIVVAALGYFVDIFDLLMFNILRVQSLTSLGIPQADLLAKGIFLLKIQMAGLLLGGILWGVLGD